MAAKHLSERENWQTDTGKRASKNEARTHSLLTESLSPTEYSIRKKPKIAIGKTTIQPELLIENLRNGKKLVIDDKLGLNGGNAHERCYRYVANGKVEKAGYLPLIVFSGRTFAAKKPFETRSKKGKVSTINPEKYRNEFREFLEPEQYFILTSSNVRELANTVKRRLS